MFALPGLLALIFIEYLRPQEYVPALYAVPLLHAATGLAVLGMALDLRLGLARLRAAPHLLLTILFFLWCLVTVIVNARSDFSVAASALLVPFAIYLVVAHGIQTFRMLQVVSGLLLAIAIALAIIGVHQGLAEYGCHRITAGAGRVVFVSDGRPCTREVRGMCDGEGAEPGAEYACEKIGLAGTQSIQGRVRYRGTLQDPNELALVIGIALPLALAFYDRRRSVARLLLVALAFAAIGACVYFTQSRGGQLVFLSVLAVYFVRRFGFARGALVGVVLALPVLFLGGRGGAGSDAESSTLERLECWWVGLQLSRTSPIFGVGMGRFIEHHYLTAHNSLILVLAELGLPGMLLWTSIVYVALKIAVRGMRPEMAPVARTWALALLASTTGLVVGTFFLSFAYKDIFWIYIGLTSVLFQAIRRHEPTFTVDFGIRDLGVVASVDLGLLAAIGAYSGWRLGFL
jgi:O-antigen ligase